MSRFARKPPSDKKSYRFIFNIAKEKHPDIWNVLHGLPMGSLSEFVRIAISEMIERKGGIEAMRKMAQGQSAASFYERLEKTSTAPPHPAPVAKPVEPRPVPVAPVPVAHEPKPIRHEPEPPRSIPITDTTQHIVGSTAIEPQHIADDPQPATTPKPDTPNPIFDMASRF